MYLRRWYCTYATGNKVLSLSLAHSIIPRACTYIQDPGWAFISACSRQYINQLQADSCNRTNARYLQIGGSTARTFAHAIWKISDYTVRKMHGRQKTTVHG